MHRDELFSSTPMSTMTPTETLHSESVALNEKERERAASSQHQTDKTTGGKLSENPEGFFGFFFLHSLRKWFRLCHKAKRTCVHQLSTLEEGAMLIPVRGLFPLR